MDRDRALVLDIVMAAKDAQDFIAMMDWEEFSRSRLHQNAVMRSLEVIGEASGKLTPAFRAAHPKIAWSDMIGMRNRLVHAYGDVRLDIVWDVASTKLPALLDDLEPLVAPDSA